MLSTDVRQLIRSSATSPAPRAEAPQTLMDNALCTLPEGSEEAAKYPQEIPATIASYVANDGKPGKADETSSPHLRF